MVAEIDEATAGRYSSKFGKGSGKVMFTRGLWLVLSILIV